MGIDTSIIVPESWACPDRKGHWVSYLYQGLLQLFFISMGNSEFNQCLGFMIKSYLRVVSSNTCYCKILVKSTLLIFMLIRIIFFCHYSSLSSYPSIRPATSVTTSRTTVYELLFAERD